MSGPDDTQRNEDSEPTRPGDEETMAVRPSLIFGEGDLGPGQRLGRYLIREELGRGGQGIVFRAQDEDLGRDVALKVLTRGGALSERARRRFEREAAIASRLEHPGLCTVYAVGTESGLPYIAMQLVRGATMDQLVRTARRSECEPPLALESPSNTSATGEASASSGSRSTPSDHHDALAAFFEDAARSLHLAHEAGLVHRDIKPANLMRNEAGTAVILDFGLARDDEASGEDDGGGMTLTGEIMGTPSFMAPEQIAGQQERIDRRSDVYALGVSLYETLTLDRPFRAATFEALTRAIRQEPPRPLRMRNPRVPRDLEVVVMTAFDRDPARRYASALDLAEDLRRFRHREPILARPAGPILRLRRWGQRNPALATLVAATLVAVLAAAGILFVKNRELARLNLDLTTASKQARQEASRADSEARAAESALAALRQETAAKEAALADYERMADVRRLRDARNELEALWPLAPELVPRLDAWSERYAPLFDRLPEHRDALGRLRKAGREVPGANEKAPTTWDFGDRAELAFQHEVLARLVEDLSAFSDKAEGARADLARRRSASSHIGAATLEAPGWEKARERVAADDRFDGFTLTPQLGLIPLGPDPVTKLEEFLDWRTQARQDETDAFTAVERNDRNRLVLAADTGLVFVLVPPGSAMIGAQSTDANAANYDPQATPLEGPVRSFSLDRPLLVAKTEITQGMWLRITGRNPSYYRIGFQGRDMERPVGALHPVERVSWRTATELLPRLDLRLPSHEEWEYFARAGSDAIWPPATSLNDLGNYANVAGREVARHFNGADPEVLDRHLLHAPIGSYAANAFGLHDVLGNIWEWTATKASENIAVACGGSYYGGSKLARVSLGFRFATDAQHDYLGVRPVRDLED